MADTKRDAIREQLNPNQGWDLLRYIAPALMTAMEASLPLGARGYAQEEIPVATNTTGALDFAGQLLEVEATAGTVTGVFTIVTGAPATTQAQVVYSATTGIATVTFNAGDAVTECRIKANELPADFVAKLAEGMWT